MSPEPKVSNCPMHVFFMPSSPVLERHCLRLWPSAPEVPATHLQYRLNSPASLPWIFTREGR